MRPMNGGARAYFVGCAAIMGFALAYVLPLYAQLPHHFYDPMARRWVWASSLGPLPMGYVGQLAWGVGGAALTAALAGLTVTRMRREPSERAYALFAAWSLTALLVAVAYFTWQNWP
jgi:hypothetical protein